jgi:hypothetical protein
MHGLMERVVRGGQERAKAVELGRAGTQVNTNTKQ